MLVIAILFTAAACEKSADKKAMNPAKKQKKTESPAADNGASSIDLTGLSSTMLYSQVYGMLTEPKQYVGSTVKIKGEYGIYENPKNGNQYSACVVTDEMGCCAAGLEFVLEEDQILPEIGTEITVRGKFEIYHEDGYAHCHLVNAKFL